MAQQFASDANISVARLLWTPGIEIWQRFGVAIQPAWAFLTPTGTLVDAAFGIIPQDRILELLAG